MNKKDLIDNISAKLPNTTKIEIGRLVDGFVETVTEALSKGEDVSLVGFGTFKVSERAARIGRNPATGAEIKIPSANVPKFVSGKSLKEAVNKPKKKKK